MLKKDKKGWKIILLVLLIGTIFSLNVKAEENTTNNKSDASNCFLGDVNLDGRIDISDAILLNKYVAGAVEFNEQQLINADVCDCDNEINSSDAIVLLKFLVSSIDTLPAYSDSMENNKNNERYEITGASYNCKDFSKFNLSGITVKKYDSDGEEIDLSGDLRIGENDITPSKIYNQSINYENIANNTNKREINKSILNLYEGEDVIGQVTVFVGLRGDTNLDGRLDSKDVSLLQSILGCNGTGKKYTEVPEFANFSDEERNLSLVLANYTSVDAETSTLPDDMYKKINSKDASELLKRLANINVEKIDVGNDYEYAQDKENVVILSYKGNLTNITELNIPETINGMKVIAINGLGPLVNVKKVKIPSSIKEISEDVFLDFCNLQEIEVDSNNTVYRSKSGILYRGTALSYCPRNINLTSLSISDDVTKIEPCAFFSNNNLKNIEIGKNVSDIGYSSFENSKIEKLSVDEENRTFFSKENTILTRDGNRLVILPAILPETFTIPVETKEIDLYNKKINKMIIPQNASIAILSLSMCEFNTIEVEKNSHINSFYLWDSTTIKEFKARDSEIKYIFGASTNIDEFEIKDTEIKFADFGELAYIKNIYIDNKDSSVSLGLFDSKVDNMNLFGKNVSVVCNGTSLQSLKLNGLNSSGVFYYSYNLKTVTLQDVNNLDCGAFEYCTSIENVVVSKQTLLRTGCFRECTNLKTVVIEGRNIIDKTMFEGCKSLTTLKIREGSLIDKDAIPENVKVIFIDENGNEV